MTGSADSHFSSLLVVARRDEVAASLIAAAERRDLPARRATPDEVLADPPGADVALRIPFGLALRLAARGSAPRLQCPGPHWLPDLPEWASGRRVHVVTLADVAAGEAGGTRLEFPARVKLPELKHPAFPARRWPSAAALLSAAAAVGMPPTTVLQHAAGQLDIHSEYRVFAAHGRTLTAAPYLVAGEEFSPELAGSPSAETAGALEFAQSVLDSLGPACSPDGLSVDVARCDDGRFLVLEANTAWAAAPYGCAPDGVLAAVLAANSGDGSRWLLPTESGDPWPVGAGG